MKRYLQLAFAAILVLGVLPSGLVAQSASNEQRIIGTWIDANDVFVWVFNADGTGLFYEGQYETPIKYGVVENKIAIVFESETAVMDFVISSDGRTIILSYFGGYGFLLRKSS